MIWWIWLFQITTETAVNRRNATLLASWQGKYPSWIIHHLNRIARSLYINGAIWILVFQSTIRLRASHMSWTSFPPPRTWSHTYTYTVYIKTYIHYMYIHSMYIYTFANGLPEFRVSRLQTSFFWGFYTPISQFFEASHRLRNSMYSW